MEFDARMKLYIVTIFMAMLTITFFENPGFAKCCHLHLNSTLTGKSAVLPDLFLVNGNSVEKVILGKSIKDVYTLYPAKRIERVLIYDAKGSYEKIEILSRDRSEVLFFIEPDCSSQDSACIIKRINITSSTYHTKKNLRVGKYYVDLLKSHEKINELTWFEGNLIIRGNEAGLSYVMQTVNIPKPWYSTMDQNTLPDSTKIIGIMITGKDLKGVSYQEIDSLNKKFLANIALKKLNSVTKQTAVKKLIKGSKKKETLSLSTVKKSTATEVQPTISASLSQPARKQKPPMPPRHGTQQQNIISQPADQQTPATKLEPGISENEKGILIESGSDTTKTRTFPDPATVK